MSDGNKIIPNTFMCFNLYVDRAMHMLTDGELRVLLFATRHILGWHDKVNTRSGRISLSMFVDGFTVTHEDGSTTHYAGCGLGEPAVRANCRSLTKFGFLKPIGSPTEKGQLWKLGDTPKWSLLEERTNARLTTRKKQVEKATQANIEKRKGVSFNDTPTSNDTPQVSLNDTPRVTSNDTQQNHDQIHVQSQVKEGAQIAPTPHLENPEPNATPLSPSMALAIDHAASNAVKPIDTDTAAMMQAEVFTSAFESECKAVGAPQQVPRGRNQRRTAGMWYRNGYTADEVRETVRDLAASGKAISFSFFEEKMAARRTASSFKANASRSPSPNRPELKPHIAPEPSAAAVEDPAERVRMAREARRQLGKAS